MSESRSRRVPSIAMLFLRKGVCSRFSHTTLLRNWSLILITCFGILSGTLWSQENTTSEETVQKPQVIGQAASQSDANVEKSPVSKFNVEKRKKAVAGMAAIGGIAILGIGTIAVTMLWARRLRRLARDLGPAQRTAGNDFWFLKPPKPTVSELEVSEIHRPMHPPPKTESPDSND